MKRTLRHSSGQTSRSSAGLICSSSWPGSTPRVRTVLRGGTGVSRAPTRVLGGRGSADHLHPREALVHQPGRHLRRRGVGVQGGGAVLEPGTKEHRGDLPVLVGAAGKGGDRGDPHLSGAVPRLREGLQDVARDVSPVPPLVLHQPPLLLLVQDLGEVTRRAGWRARAPGLQLRFPHHHPWRGRPVSTCSVSPFLTLSSCEFLAWKSYRARTSPWAGRGGLEAVRGWISTQPGTPTLRILGEGDTYTCLGPSLQPVAGGCAGGRDRDGCPKGAGETEAGGGASWRPLWLSCSITGGSHPSEKTGMYAGTWALLGYSALQPSGRTPGWVLWPPAQIQTPLLGVGGLDPTWTCSRRCRGPSRRRSRRHSGCPRGIAAPPAAAADSPPPGPGRGWGCEPGPRGAGDGAGPPKEPPRVGGARGDLHLSHALRGGTRFGGTHEGQSREDEAQQLAGVRVRHVGVGPSLWAQGGPNTAPQPHRAPLSSHTSRPCHPYTDP